MLRSRVLTTNRKTSDKKWRRWTSPRTATAHVFQFFFHFKFSKTIGMVRKESEIGQGYLQSQSRQYQKRKEKKKWKRKKQLALKEKSGMILGDEVGGETCKTDRRKMKKGKRLKDKETEERWLWRRAVTLKCNVLLHMNPCYGLCNFVPLGMPTAISTHSMSPPREPCITWYIFHVEDTDHHFTIVMWLKSRMTRVMSHDARAIRALTSLALLPCHPIPRPEKRYDEILFAMLWICVWWVMMDDGWVS